MSITLIIIIFTSLISWHAFNRPDMIMKLSHHPYQEYRNKEYYRFLSSAFLHGGLFHLFVNMFVLYGFGEFVERKFIGFYGELGGKVGFLIFYLFLAICANIPTYFKNKENYHYHSIGASGATSGIVFSYILFEPTSMLYLFLAIPIPAIVFGVLYLWYSSYASKTQADRIDHDAHFYGAVAGFLFTLALKPDLFSSFVFKITHWF